MISVEICPSGCPAGNWAFDVTPARLVTGLITERGVAKPAEGLATLFPEQSLMRRWTILYLLLMIGLRLPNRSTAPEAKSTPPWKSHGPEAVRWHADEPFFAQNFAIEASGLAASDRFSWVSSEKYGGLLLVDLLVGVRM